MGYYEDLLTNIDNLINDDNFNEAKSLIDKELALPYVPKNVEDKLIKYLDELPREDTNKSLSDEDIIEYLKQNETKQLRAVEELNKKNLRDYVDICNEYLCSDGFINAKVLLIDSLIRQEISDDIKMINNGIEYEFIPKYVLLPEESLGFKKAIDILNDKFMKEPSKLELAKGLVYKECVLALPVNYEENEAEYLANKVYEYIVEAFK